LGLLIYTADKLLHSECNGTSAQKGYLLLFKVYTMERIYGNNLQDGKTYECKIKAIKPKQIMNINTKTVKSKFLHRALVLVNAYKCVKFQLPSSISY